jgi:hypothetical protein
MLLLLMIRPQSRSGGLAQDQRRGGRGSGVGGSGSGSGSGGGGGRRPTGVVRFRLHAIENIVQKIFAGDSWR